MSASFCWWCGKKLTMFPSKPNKGTTVEVSGVKHTVHKTCAKDIKKPLTAQDKIDAAYHGDIDGDFNYW